MKFLCNAYTDGAWKSNTEVGGWGYHLSFTDPESETIISLSDFNGERNTTNQRMEMTAMLQCLKNIPRGCHAKIHSDSKYVLCSIVKDGTGTLTKLTHLNFSGWLKKWLECDSKGNPNWKKSDGKPVENMDLWKEIVKECKLLTETKDVILEFQWVKAHANNEGNNEADRLANCGVYKILNNNY